MVTSSIAEPDVGDPPLWDPAITYNYDDSLAPAYIQRSQVTVAGDVHKIYENITTVTGGDSPEISVTRPVPQWIEVSNTNKWAMFDLLRSTVSSASSSPITVTLTPGETVSALALLGLGGIEDLVVSATSVTGGGTVYSNTLDLTDTTNTVTWYSYYTGSVVTKESVLLFDLPSQYSDIIITIVATGPGDISIGSCVIGTDKYLGRLQNGFTSDIVNFSTMERDIFGNATLIQRRSVPKTNQRIFVDKTALNNLIEIKKSLEAAPAVWSGMDDKIDDPYFDAMIILGFYRSFSFQLDNPIGPTVVLELEEI